MAAPAHAQTWQFRGNQKISPNSVLLTQTRPFMYAIKESMVGGGTWTDKTGSTVASAGNWTVTSSCNGPNGTGGGPANSFGNNDNVDHWLSVVDLTWGAAAANHSWCVLQQTGIAAKFQVCIDLNVAAGGEYFCTIVYSPAAGFGAANGGADGTATARPTATDEKVLITANVYGAPSAVSTGSYIHVMKTSDGKCFRIFVTRDNRLMGMWFFEVPDNWMAGGWTNPSVAYANGTNNSGAGAGEIPLYTQFEGASNIWARTGANQFSMYGVCMGDPQGTARSYLTYSFALDNSLPFIPIGLYSNTVVGTRGYNGVIKDCFWSWSPVTQTGFSFPQSTAPGDVNARQWMQFGPFVVPWDKSFPRFRV